MRYKRANLAIRVSVLIAVILSCNCAIAQSFSPARLIELADKDDIDCPSDIPTGTTFFCQVVVSPAGRAVDEGSTHCFSSPGSRERVGRELRRSMLESEFVPAVVDGEPVSVYASFRVFLVQERRECNATVFPNLGTNTDSLGAEYIAPQEIYSDGGWLARMASEERDWGTPRGLSFAMSVAVDESGQAGDGRVESDRRASEETINAAIRALEASRFIPAFLGSEPRPARYFEFMIINP